jgi:uncharacterized protein (TIGR02099 family)
LKAALPAQNVAPKRGQVGRLRRLAVRLLASVIILAALVLALTLLALPWLAAHPKRIEAWLSAALNTEVRIEQARSVPSARPQLLLSGLTIAGTTKFDQVALDVDPYGFLPGRRWVRDFSVLGAELTLEQTDAGWLLHGFSAPDQAGGDISEKLTRFAQHLDRVRQFSVLDGNLKILPKDSASISLRGVGMALRRSGAMLRLGLVLPTQKDVSKLLPRAALREDAGGSAHMVIEFDQTRAQGRAYIEFSKLPLAQLGESLASKILSSKIRGTSSGQLWFDFRDQQLSGGQLSVRLFDEKAQDTLTLLAHSSNGADWGAVATLAGSPEPTSAQLSAKLQLERWVLTVDQLALPSLQALALAHVPDSLAQSWSKPLAGMAPGGHLEHIVLRAGTNQPMRVRAQMVNVSMRPFGVWPGLRNVDALVFADGDATVAQLSAKDLVFELPRSLRKPISPERIQSDLSYTKTTEGWQGALENLVIQDQDYHATGYLHVRQDQALASAPEMLLNLAISDGNVTVADQFFPYDKIPKRALQWLDEALLAGRVHDARLIWRGPLEPKQFPYHLAQGRMEARFGLADARVKFSPDWPESSLRGDDFEFVNDRFSANMASGMIAGNAFENLHAHIEAFSEPVLELETSANSEAKHLLALLRASPVGVEYGSQFEQLSMSGPATVQTQLRLPLKRELGEKRITGAVQFLGNTVANQDWNVALSQVKGGLQFDGNGFSTAALSGIQAGEPIRLEVAVGKAHQKNPMHIINATLSGRMRAQTIFGHETAIAEILSKTEGVSQWRVNVITERLAAGVQSTLQLSSDLVGTSIAIPAPIGKAAGAAKALRLSVPIGGSISRPSERLLSLELDNDVRLLAYLPTPMRAGEDGVVIPARPFAGLLQLGNAQDSAQAYGLPERGLQVQGRFEKLDTADWAGLVGGALTTAGSAWTLAGLDVQAKHLIGIGGAAKVTARKDQENWSVVLDSEPVAGTVRWIGGADRTPSLSVDLTRLYLPEPDAKSAYSTNFDPKLVPALHVYIKDFQVGDAKLGATRLETFPSATGMRVDLLESKSKTLSLTGSGDWTGNFAQGKSQFKLRFSAEDLGNMLASLGFAGHVSGGQTLCQIDATWQGAPIEFALANGRFLELNPGAGRLFGLLSVRELPRRLALDFRDFFQAGMGFNEIKGNFRFERGNAYTEDLRIYAPSADITIKGRTGLSARDYDQHAKVVPKMGVLPVVGAVAAGPVGAAAGVIAQSVLGSDKVLAAEYKIDGTWEKPNVVKIRMPGAQASARSRDAHRK